jgi:hypothetical protein
MSPRETLPVSQIGHGWRPGRGSQPQAYRFARRMAAPLTPGTPRTRRMWWTDGWWGDQGLTSECTIYSWLHLVHDGPVTHPRAVEPLVNPTVLYREGQRIDGTPETEIDSGLTSDAAARVMRARGFIQRYEWAETVDEIARALLEVGPVPFGTWWRTGMDAPSKLGIIRYDGDYRGGHQVLLNGVDLANEYVRGKNSWGRDWARKGHFTLSFRDLEAALVEGAEAAVAVEAP